MALLDGVLHSDLEGILQAIEGNHGHVLGEDIDPIIDFLIFVSEGK